MLENIWFQLFTIVFVATVHGYGAAWLAVRMLFRPRNPIKFLGITVFPQGMIPRHRARMAETIGKAVGNELVSQETILEAFFEKEFLRKKIQGVVDSYSEELLTKNYPSLLDALPTGAREPVLEAIASVQLKVGEYLAEFLRNEETVSTIGNFVDKRVDEILSQRVSQVIDEEAFIQIIDFVEKRVKNVLNEKIFEEKLRGFVSRRIDDFANTNATLQEILSDESVSLIKEKLAEQIQPIVRHFAELITQERTRNQIGALVKREINDYYEQLAFYQKIFVSREKLYHEVDDLVNKTLPKRIEEVLNGEFFAEEAANFLNTTIDTVASRPITEILGQIAPDKLESFKDQISLNLIRIIQSDEINRQISAYLTDTIHKIRPHSLKAILERLSPEAAPRLKNMLTKGLLSILQRPETAQIVNSVVAGQIEQFLVMPIGKLSDRLPETTVRNTGKMLTETIISAAKEKLPQAIQEFDVGGLVKEKVNEFPAERLEALVLSIAEKHLRTIERFGAVIGFLIGIFQAFYFWTFAGK